MIENLKDLKKLLQLCRAQGVTEIDLGSVKFKLGDLPSGKPQEDSDNEIDSDNPYSNFPDRVLTPEELMYYSAGGLPEDAPEATQ